MIEVREWSFLEWECEKCIGGLNLQLAGICNGDYRFDDGAYIITSRIISSNGRSVVTENGTHYLLKGPPSKYWLMDKAELGANVDCDDPLKKYFHYIYHNGK